LLIGLGN